MPTLDWIGKDKIVSYHREIPYCVLNRKYSYDSSGQHEENNDSDNMIIHGDNLYALKSLLPKYEGRIKCIYIDPPYNTGNKDWCYNDNVDDPLFRKWLNEVLNSKESERYVHIDDLTRHDKWLCMMYPRLKLLQKLLSKDGAIFISIDDNEQSNLRQICDEIFGQSNFVTNIIWEKNYSPRNDANYFSASHDFIVVYAKEKDYWNRNLLPRSEKQNKFYKYDDNDGRGLWRPDNVLVKTFSETGVFGIKNPNTGEVHYPPKGSCYRFSYEKSLELLKDNRIYFGKDGKGKPQLKRYLSEVNAGVVPQTIWHYEEVSHSQEGKKELNEIIEGNVFDTPKPTKLIQYILTIATDKESIILDSFAGSGSTAHAVIKQNNEDGGNRKFICIEMLDYAETVTSERIKRAIKGYNDKGPLKGSFSYYELGEPLIEDGELNENIPLEQIKEFIYYTETGEKYSPQDNQIKYYLGKVENTGYYFCYEKNETIALDETIINVLDKSCQNYVIYANVCYVPDSVLKANNITFKKIPRDIGEF